MVLKTNAQKIIEKSNKVLFHGKVKRYEFLESVEIEYRGVLNGGIISIEYLMEAKRCWVEGMFFSTIIMMQMAFEEGLRGVLKARFVMKEDKENLDIVNKRGFLDIIDLARSKKFITKKEHVRLNELRKMRNPIVHVKREKFDFGETSEFALIKKISEMYKVEKGMIDESGIEKEAKKSLSLVNMYYEIFSRWFF